MKCEDAIVTQSLCASATPFGLGREKRPVWVCVGGCCFGGSNRQSLSDMNLFALPLQIPSIAPI
jgi:hypothetical protein